MNPGRDPKGWHSRGYLPHFDSPEKIQHIVFRTADSLPATFVAALPADASRRRRDVEACLDECEEGRLLDPSAAAIVESALRHFDGARYRMFGWCVMPNHVHVVTLVFADRSPGDIVRSWKTFSAAAINRARGREGAFWALDYFDRYMRDEDDLARTVDYVEQNPVKAGLVEKPEEWPWSSARLKRQ